MKKAILIIIVSALVGLAFTMSVTWKADDKASTVSWELPGADKKGTFSNLSSTIDFDKAKLAESKITASIEVKTLKAGSDGLEKHLMSADFFNADKFPKITFTSTNIYANGDSFVAKGNLTMKDSTKIIEIPFTFKENGTDKAIFSGTMTVNPNDYGVTKKDPDGSGGVNKVVIYLVVPVTK